MTTAVEPLDPSPILVERVYEQLMLAITARRPRCGNAACHACNNPRHPIWWP